MAATTRFLTLGDGDLSYSLALARCYGTAVSLTATTLCSEAELRAKYALAGAHMTELRALGAAVIHGVDACTLDPRALGEHVRKAMITNAELLLMQERRLQLLHHLVCA